MTKKQIKARLEYLRGELRAEGISWGEIAELQSLAAYIEPGDVELLEPAGVPEFGRKAGDKVRVTFFEVEYPATVTRDQRSNIVLLHFDGETLERWFNEESVLDR